MYYTKLSRGQYQIVSNLSQQHFYASLAYYTVSFIILYIFSNLHIPHSQNHFLDLSCIPIRKHLSGVQALKEDECTPDTMVAIIYVLTGFSSVDLYRSLFALNRQLYCKFIVL